MGLRDWIGLVLQPKHHCSLRNLIQVEIQKNCEMVHELVGDCDHNCDNCRATQGVFNLRGYEVPHDRQEPFLPYCA